MPISYVSDSKSTIMNGMLTGLYYYFVDANKITGATYLASCNTIVNVCFNPFLSENDLNLHASSFNTDKYGQIDNTIPTVYRIRTGNKIEKTLMAKNVFSTKSYMAGTDPKLLVYPYRYYILTDYINPPLLIKPQFVPNNGKCEIKVITSVSTEGKYNLSVKGYKGDNNGNLEGINTSANFMIANTGSAYSQFLSTSASQFAQEKINTSLENDLTLKQAYRNNNLELQKQKLSYDNSQISNGFNTLANLLGGKIASLGGNAYKGAYNYYSNQLEKDSINNSFQNTYEAVNLSEANLSTMINAKITDMINTPKSLISSGNDSLFNINLSNKKIDLIEYTVTDEQAEKLSDHFRMFGYSYNRWRPLSTLIKSRKYFNYIQTNICNVHGDKIPYEDLEEIKAIFNRGLTFWHVENNIDVGDYARALNNEVI